MTKRHLIIFLVSFLTSAFGQKSNLYQIFADEINQQTFIDKKVTKIERVGYSLNKSTGKLVKDKGIIKIEYYPDKKLCRTSNSYYDKNISYWRSDTNGVNDFSFDKNGKQEDQSSFSSSAKFEGGKLKSIYTTLLFYDNNNKIIKTTLDSVDRLRDYFNECYYFYKGDSLIKSNCYQFQFNGEYTNRKDTISKTTTTKNETLIETFDKNKKTLIRKVTYEKNNITITDTYTNNELTGRLETYYK